MNAARERRNRRKSKCPCGWSYARAARNCWVLVVITVFLALPATIWDMHDSDYERHIIAWFVAGCFVLLTIPISLGEVVLHLYNYTNPKLQHYVIRIIWMVPIYAVDSWLALRFKEFDIYLDAMRDCYEAYVIYNFTFFLLASLGEETEVREILANKPQPHHTFPFCFLPKWDMRDGTFIKHCKHGVLSYTVVKLMTTITILALQWAGEYEEGNFDPTKAYLYISIANNCAQIWALYCLVLFYQACKDELAKIQPIPKFLCVKAVVFFSWWQSIAVSILVYLKIIKEEDTWTVYDIDSVAAGIQDFLICIEMFFASLACLYAFSHRDFKDSEAPRAPFLRNLAAMFDVTDVKMDLLDHVSHVRTVIRRDLLTLTPSKHPDQINNSTDPTSTSTSTSIGVTTTTPVTHLSTDGGPGYIQLLNQVQVDVDLEEEDDDYHEEYLDDERTIDLPTHPTVGGGYRAVLSNSPSSPPLASTITFPSTLSVPITSSSSVHYSSSFASSSSSSSASLNNYSTSQNNNTDSQRTPFDTFPSLRTRDSAHFTHTYHRRSSMDSPSSLKRELGENHPHSNNNDDDDHHRNLNSLLQTSIYSGGLPSMIIGSSSSSSSSDNHTFLQSILGIPSPPPSFHGAKKSSPISISPASSPSPSSPVTSSSLSSSSSSSTSSSSLNSTNNSFFTKHHHHSSHLHVKPLSDLTKLSTSEKSSSSVVGVTYNTLSVDTSSNNHEEKKDQNQQKSSSDLLPTGGVGGVSISSSSSNETPSSSSGDSSNTLGVPNTNNNLSISNLSTNEQGVGDTLVSPLPATNVIPRERGLLERGSEILTNVSSSLTSSKKMKLQ